MKLYRVAPRGSTLRVNWGSVQCPGLAGTGQASSNMRLSARDVILFINANRERFPTVHVRSAARVFGLCRVRWGGTSSTSCMWDVERS